MWHHHRWPWRCSFASRHHWRSHALPVACFPAAVQFRLPAILGDTQGPSGPWNAIPQRNVDTRTQKRLDLRKRSAEGWIHAGSAPPFYHRTEQDHPATHLHNIHTQRACLSGSYRCRLCTACQPRTNSAPRTPHVSSCATTRLQPEACLGRAFQETGCACFGCAIQERSPTPVRSPPCAA